MAVANPILRFPEQITETRKCIKDRFKKCHESLLERENYLLARVDKIETEYKQKLQLQNETVESLTDAKSFNSDKLKANVLTETREQIVQLLDNKLKELTADTDTSIEFVWDNLFEADISQLGTIKLNGLSIISSTNTFPPHLKPIIPDYRAKQLPTSYCCKKSSDQKAPGELGLPRGITIHYKTGNVYITDMKNNCVQVFSSNADYLFRFSEKMNGPKGICISQNKVFVAQHKAHCVNMYELEGKLVKSVGNEGNGEAQFKGPYSLDISERSSNVYVCDTYNCRVQVLTESLKFHSMLGIDLLKYPRDVKVTRDRVFVLDISDPCVSVFDSNHVITNRLITRGDGKQTNQPYCFDIDRDYNIVMSDYGNHCVCVFSQKGEQIHKFGKEGQGIGEF